MTESDPGRTCLSTLRENGIDWNRPPERLDAATLFAPAGRAGSDRARGARARGILSIAGDPSPSDPTARLRPDTSWTSAGS